MKSQRHIGSLMPTIGLCPVPGLLLVVAFLSSCGSTSGAEPMLSERTIPPDATLAEGPRPVEPVTVHPRLDSTLNQLLEAYDGQGFAGAQTFAETHGMVLEGRSVQVVIVTTPDAVEALTEAVEGRGGEVQGHYEGQVQALVPIEALASLAELPDVQRIREPQRAVP